MTIKLRIAQENTIVLVLQEISSCYIYNSVEVLPSGDDKKGAN